MPNCIVVAGARQTLYELNKGGEESLIILLFLGLALRRIYIETKKQYGVLYAIVAVVALILAILFLDT